MTEVRRRVNMRMDPELHARLAEYAKEHGMTFTAVVEEAVREILEEATR